MRYASANIMAVATGVNRIATTYQVGNITANRPAQTCDKSDFQSWVADAYLTKSSDISELKNTIDSILHHN